MDGLGYGMLAETELACIALHCVAGNDRLLLLSQGKNDAFRSVADREKEGGRGAVFSPPFPGHIKAAITKLCMLACEEKKTNKKR